MRIRNVLALLVILASSLSAAPRAQTASPLAPLGFLLGAWDALPDASGNTGRCAFTSSLQGQVIVRTNHADTKATSTQPASSHDDLMVIYVDGGVVKAAQPGKPGAWSTYLAWAMKPAR